MALSNRWKTISSPSCMQEQVQ
ncbi:Protein of unknown function [Pyronema omphalodes CBS 100304]|uniref:Uncharacterized protein n=1 Tax=Pyronema omphalodes (strain CBS 100304) TaxID=1076935 RepID=U4KX83_PYROM|nr:Protein of unknown function [Pyronema omphalodes CBS 100304]